MQELFRKKKKKGCNCFKHLILLYTIEVDNETNHVTLM